MGDFTIAQNLTVGTVAALNHSNVLKAYSFSDFHPLEGQNLYRLKMVDRAADRQDASFAYSRIVGLTFGEDNKIIAYPNPARDFVTVSVAQRYIGSGATLINISGTILSRIVIDREMFSIDLRQYAAGLFLLQTWDGKYLRIIKH